MTKDPQLLFEKRRKYVNEKYGNLTRGKRMTKKTQDKLLKRLWKQAKRKVK